jgi:hypothetical protein
VTVPVDEASSQRAPPAINEAAITIAVLSFGVAWLLYEIAREESPDTVFALLCAAAVSYPFTKLDYFALWTGAVSLVWVAACAGMHRLALITAPRHRTDWGRCWRRVYVTADAAGRFAV